MVGLAPSALRPTLRRERLASADRRERARDRLLLLLGAEVDAFGTHDLDLIGTIRGHASRNSSSRSPFAAGMATLCLLAATPTRQTSVRNVLSRGE